MTDDSNPYAAGSVAKHDNAPAPTTDIDFGHALEQLRTLGSVVIMAPDGVPRGTIKDLLDWVDSDPGRAQQALDVELATSSPRPTLVSSLRKLTDAVT